MTPVIGKEERIINAWHSGWEADPEMTVSEWADERRILAGEGSVEPGKFRTSRTPYLKEIMEDRKSTRLNSSHTDISYAVFCLKKKKKTKQ